MLKNKNILLGISGGIAAYKSVDIASKLIKAGANVKVVATENGLRFVSKLSLETVTHAEVYTDMFPENTRYEVAHIALTDWADALVVAPATANIIGKFANGIADDALSTTFLAFNKDVFIVPAMNTKMYDNAAVQENLQKLIKRKINIIDPTFGQLACGIEGKGRMETPAKIVEILSDFYSQQQSLKKKS